MLTCSGRTCSQMNQLRECIGNEIQWLRNQGIKENLTLISNKFHYDIRIVRDVRNRINCNHSITNSYSKSTKQKITEDIGHFIEIMTIANRSISGRGLSELILQKFNVHITKTTINKYRKQIGFKYGPQIRTFILTEEQKQKRLEFAKKNINNTFENVLFTDESYFELNGLRWIWRRKNEKTSDVFFHREAHPTKIMVWGGISKNYKTRLVIFNENETMSAKDYISKILRGGNFDNDLDVVYPGGWVFMQDNAPPHKAKITMDYLDNVHWGLLDWPAHSPDLNIIEHVWSWMKRKVIELEPRNVEDLISILNSVWDSIDQKHIDNLIASIPRRLNYLIETKGEQITCHI